MDRQRWCDLQVFRFYRFSRFSGLPVFTVFQVSGFSRYGLQYGVTLSLGLAVASASLFSHYWVSGLNPSAPFGKSSA